LTWPTAFNDLGDALDAAAAIASPTTPVEIWVAEGSYAPDPTGLADSREATFLLPEETALYGGFPIGGGEGTFDTRDPATYPTILSGDLNNDDADVSSPTELADEPTREDNSYTVVSYFGDQGGVFIDGFTIRGGNANGTESPYRRGGGLLYMSRGDVTLVRCAFERNSARVYGGGVYFAAHTATIIACDFTENIVTEGDATVGRGAGLFIEYSSEYRGVVVTDSNFTRNRAGRDGGAIHNGAENGALTVTNCTFRDNEAEWAGGAVNQFGDDTVFSDCAFVGNRSVIYYGGAVYVAGKWTTTFARCTFSDNSAMVGGAVYKYGVLTDCTLIGNRATSSYGGGIYGGEMAVNCTFIGNVAQSWGGGAYGTPSLTNCLFVANKAREGAGLFTTGRSAATNCTFVGNAAQDTGGGVRAGRYWDSGDLTLTNSIVWANRAGGMVDAEAQINMDAGLAIVRYSCVQGGWSGEGGIGNIDLDPLFVRMPSDGGDGWGVGDNDDLGDLRLICTSPCLNAGTNDVDTDLTLSGVQPLPDTDLDGRPRIADGVVDMGAYEGPRPGFLVSAEAVVVAEGGSTEFTVALACEPLGPVNVEVVRESGDEDIAVVSGATLAFDSSNFATPQPVTLAAAEDDDQTGGIATIRISGGDIPYRDVTALERENDVPPIIHVDEHAAGGDDGTSWSDALTDLQTALSLAAGSGGAVSEIWIAAGVYRPSRLLDADDPRSATFLLADGVGVYGGFVGAYAAPGFVGETTREERDPIANETVLHGDLNGDDTGDIDDPSRDDNAWRVVTAEAVGVSTVLDGVILTGGGGMETWYGNPTIVNCTFAQNFALYGAGLYNRFGDPTVRDCVFRDSVAATSGGGFRSDRGQPTLINCLFSRNRASMEGGGMYATDAILTECTFEGNWSDDDGGGYSGTGSLTGCVFVGNHAEDGGGAVYHGSILLKNCTFESNSAGEQGGAVCTAHQRDYEIEGCRFHGNSARKGGAIHEAERSDSIVTNTSFTENTAEYGGAIYFYKPGLMRLTNCRFGGNSSESAGGAIEAISASMDLTNCTLAGNAASTAGGALWLKWSNTTLVNCTVAANVADTVGGGVHMEGSSLSTSNSVLWANTDSDGANMSESAQVHVDGGTVTAHYTCVQDNDPDDASIPFGGAANGNVDDDPRLVRHPDSGPDGAWDGVADDYGDLRLLPGSPCIDAADNTAVPADVLDLDDDGDTTEPVPFDLAGNARIADDPDTPDTGSPPGAEAIVDMGAYEGPALPVLLSIVGGTDAVGNSASLVWPKQESVGLTEFDIRVDQPVTLAGGGGEAAGSIEVLDVTHTGGGVHRVLLDQAIPLAQWTVLELTVVGAGGGESTFEICLGHLPADINGDGQVNMGDVTAFGAYFGPNASAADLVHVDLNGNGQTNLNDATLMGQLWHGTSGHSAWQNASLPPKP